VTTDASSHARRRLQLLENEREIEVRSFPGIAAVDPGELAPPGGVDHSCPLICRRWSHAAVVFSQPSRVAVAIQNVIDLGADEEDE
jgi:hypothetical protein